MNTPLAPAERDSIVCNFRDRARFVYELSWNLFIKSSKLYCPVDKTSGHGTQAIY